MMLIDPLLRRQRRRVVSLEEGRRGLDLCLVFDRNCLLAMEVGRVHSVMVEGRVRSVMEDLALEGSSMLLRR